MPHPRAGTVAQPEDLIDIDQLVGCYFDLTPDPQNKSQRVVFGTSGHRGTATTGGFNQAHIWAITQAICEYRKSAGTTGPLLLGRDTHALSRPAWESALQVLVAHNVEVLVDAKDGYTPTPAVSRAIVQLNHQGHRADGILVTPSHNPPSDGGFKYNPPHGGPADSTITNQIASRANELLGNLKAIHRVDVRQAVASAGKYDFLAEYVTSLEQVIDVAAISGSGIRIGADPMGGASVDYWGAIAERYHFDLTVVNSVVDPQWGFMTLDWDGKIRMDCSSSHAMASLIAKRDEFDVAVGNDADADRHGIVTADGGLMNPNHFLAVAIDYLFGGSRPNWSPSSAIGKTLVSSTMIDRVAKNLSRALLEVPVGFKWFVEGLSTGELGFGGEESAGATFLKQDGSVWTTDKDGILLSLLAAEIAATSDQSASQRYTELCAQFGSPTYARIDAPANSEQKLRLAQLSNSDVSAQRVAGEPVQQVLTKAPGNGAAIGGVKVVTENAWFAARPSGTEDVYKIYAESFLGESHLREVQREAQAVVDAAIS
jgi:alpha-D-glucose phosphate-specific phosphoglucomutase